MINRVDFSDQAKRDLKKVPNYIADKLFGWVNLVEKTGIEQARKIKGFHDEPLSGKRRGQRSIRLSLSYRAIYVVKADGTSEFLSVEEVNKHEY